jgi:hypothetical protein
MSLENKDLVEKLILNKNLTSIEFYNVNDNYFELDNEKILIIDGGVEMLFDTHKLSIGWNKELELLDTVVGDISLLLDDLKYFTLEKTSTKNFTDQIGKKVISIQTQFEAYQLLDEELEPTGAYNHFLKELIIEFDDANKLQIAIVKYDIDIENKKINNAVFDPQGELLISLNNIIDIKDPEEIN